MGALVLHAVLCACSAATATDTTVEIAASSITPSVTTTPASDDVDDPAIWIHPSDQSRSLILGTVKAAAPAGALVVYALDGSVVQTIRGLDRPNNVDVEYGFRLAGRSVDIVVVTERISRQLRLFQVTDDGHGLREIGRLPVLEGVKGDDGAPMGVGLYRRPRDGNIYAIVSPKHGPAQEYLWQYLLEDDGRDGVRARLIRRFGRFSGRGEIEAVAVDDALGYVYYADEETGIHKWHADPDVAGAGVELAEFGREGFTGDREGIAVYAAGDGTGYVVCTDQRPGRSEYRLYRREGEPGRPHDHRTTVKVLSGPADSTDGIEVVAQPLGAALPHGMLVAMNSRGRNFLFFPWEQVARNGAPQLRTAAAAPTR